MNSTGKADFKFRTPIKAPDQTTNNVPVVKTEQVAEVKAKGPENQYGAKGAHETVRNDGGKPVTTTATTAQLWGPKWSSERPPLEALGFKNFTTTQAKAKLAELEKRKANIEERMAGRAGELDDKWRYLRLTKRTEILKDYLSKSPNLPDAQRSELQAKIADSEAAKSKLDDLQKDVKALKPQEGSKKPGTPEERAALAKALWAARRQHSDAVKDGTATVDNAGLKYERLALTENQIDPSGGVGSKYGSMNELFGMYYETSYMLNTVQNMYFGPFAQMIHDMASHAKDAKRNDDIRAEEIRAKEIRDSWLKNKDGLAHDLLKEIGSKTETHRSNAAR